MSDGEDLKKTIELLALLKSVNQDSPPTPNTTDNITSKLNSSAAFVFTVLSIVGVIVFIGMKTQKWDDSKEAAKAELKVEFAEKFSQQQERFSDDYRDISTQVRYAVEDNKDLKIIIKELENDNSEIRRKLEEYVSQQKSDNESFKRSDNETYRNIQWLKSQHNINTPP